MHPKDLALIVWCQARLRSPLYSEFVEKSFKLVNRYVQMILNGELLYMPSEIGSKPVYFEMDFDEEIN